MTKRMKAGQPSQSTPVAQFPSVWSSDNQTSGSHVSVKITESPGTGTHIGIVLDESGSMSPNRASTIDGINEYLATARADFPGAKLTLVQFDDPMSNDDRIRVKLDAVSCAFVKDLTEADYAPRGGTPLYDAIGETITRMEATESERYLLVVLTDGLENRSVEWKQESVKKAITEREARGNWTVIYLGANQDAWAVGAAMGVKQGNTVAWTSTPDGTKNTMRSVSGATAAYMSEGSALPATGTFFADAGQTSEDYDDKPKAGKPRAARSRRAGSPQTGGKK